MLRRFGAVRQPRVRIVRTRRQGFPLVRARGGARSRTGIQRAAPLRLEAIRDAQNKPQARTDAKLPREPWIIRTYAGFGDAR